MEVPEFGYQQGSIPHTFAYIEPAVRKVADLNGKGRRLLDVGCGSGFWAGHFLKQGFGVVGVDPSAQGIELARQSYPQARFERTLATDDLLSRIGEAPFDLVTSFEVVEHVYEPKDWARACFNALKPGGQLVCSTPYHGYLKNLALSVANKWDSHLGPLWSGGHIKFWSKNTLFELLRGEGFVDCQFAGAGRLPYLWMSMVVSARRPS
jgi:2-polyprenyl-3-methyl-5-hydroxy-6-metoxy-1,4-benzoquinol methylase